MIPFLRGLRHAMLACLVTVTPAGSIDVAAFGSYAHVAIALQEEVRNAAALAFERLRPDHFPDTYEFSLEDYLAGVIAPDVPTTVVPATELWKKWGAWFHQMPATVQVTGDQATNAWGGWESNWGHWFGSALLDEARSATGNPHQLCFALGWLVHGLSDHALEFSGPLALQHPDNQGAIPFEGINLNSTLLLRAQFERMAMDNEELRQPPPGAAQTGTEQVPYLAAQVGQRTTLRELVLKTLMRRPFPLEFEWMNDPQPEAVPVEPPLVLQADSYAGILLILRSKFYPRLKDEWSKLTLEHYQPTVCDLLCAAVLSDACSLLEPFFPGSCPAVEELDVLPEVETETVEQAYLFYAFGSDLTGLKRTAELGAVQRATAALNWLARAPDEQPPFVRSYHFEGCPLPVVRIMFNEPVKLATLTSANITLTGSVSGTMASEVAANGPDPTEVSVTPASPFVAGETVTIRVSSEVEDLAGNRLGQTYTASARMRCEGIPTAEAGLAQTLADEDGDGEEAVQLDGSASGDSDGTIVDWRWSREGAWLATGPQPSVTLPVGNHLLTLTVTDDSGLSDSDTVTIAVLPSCRLVRLHYDFPFLENTRMTQYAKPAALATIATEGVLSMNWVTAGTHCSDVRMHFLMDGREVAVFGPLGPGQETGFLNVGPGSPGSHCLAFEAEGLFGGCNGGWLHTWGGYADVLVSAKPGLLPRLEHEVRGKLMMLSWLAASEKYLLETAASLAEDAVWEAANEVVEFLGTRFYVVVEIGVGERYYRLRLP